MGGVANGESGERGKTVSVRATHLSKPRRWWCSGRVDEQTQAVEIRRRRSRAEAEQLAAEFEGSGLSRIEFCRKQGLSLATLARYRKLQTQGSAARGNRWLAVEVSSASLALGGEASSGLAVALPGGRRIEVGRGFDGPTLVQLLGVLERF